MMENDNDPNGRNLHNDSRLMTLGIIGVVIYIVGQGVWLLLNFPW
jgi:hypothetical protein